MKKNTKNGKKIKSECAGRLHLSFFLRMRELFAGTLVTHNVQCVPDLLDGYIGPYDAGSALSVLFVRVAALTEIA